MYKFQIYRKLETANGLKRWHTNPRPHVGRALYRAYKKELAKLFWEANPEACRAPLDSARKNVRVAYYTKKLQDRDNFIACLKPVLDVMKGVGVIADDSEEFIKLDAVQEINLERAYLMEVEVENAS